MSFTTKVVLIAIAGVLALSALFWGISVAVSGPKGQGDAYKEKNSSKNWVQAQHDFNQKYQGIIALDKNIDQSYKALQRDPKDTRRQIEYDGNVRNCNTAVADYNTLALSYLSKDFRDANLPYQIDDNDPKTDCKEN